MKLDDVQNHLKRKLASAKLRQVPLDHILLCGPRELTQDIFWYLSVQAQVRARVFAAASFRTPGDLNAVLTHLKMGSVLYIDEIHCLKRWVVPVLSSAMQDFALDVVLGKAPHVKNVRLNLPPFTVLAATTRPTLLAYQLHTLFHTEYQIHQR